MDSWFQHVSPGADLDPRIAWNYLENGRVAGVAGVLHSPCTAKVAGPEGKVPDKVDE